MFVIICLITSFQICKSYSPFEGNKMSYLTKCPSFSFAHSDDQGWTSQ